MSDATVPPSADELLRELARTDPQAAVDQVLGELGRPGLLGPILDVCSVETLLTAPSLDPTQLRRVVEHGVLQLRSPRQAVLKAAARTDLDDDLAVQLTVKHVQASLYASVKGMTRHEVWQAFRSGGHPVAGASLLASLGLQTADPDVARATTTWQQSQLRAQMATAMTAWLTRMRQHPDPGTVSSVVAAMAPTWAGSPEDLLTAAADVAH